MLLTKELEKEYIEFLKKCKKGHFMQTPMWAKVKQSWKNEVIIVKNDEGSIVGSMSILIRKMPVFGKTIMYCGRGPVYNIGDDETFLKLIDEAKELAKKVEAGKVEVKIKVGEGGRTFGSVSTKEIAIAVKEQMGYDIDKKKIQLKDAIKTLGTHVVPVKLHQQVTAELKVIVTEE